MFLNESNYFQGKNRKWIQNNKYTFINFTTCHFVEYADSLLKAGCKVSISNNEGRTALHVAAQIDNYRAIRLLIQHNSNVKKTDLKVNISYT